MPSERIQRQIGALLDQAEVAVARREWQAVAEAARAVRAIDAGNEDAAAFLKMAVANGVDGGTLTSTPAPEAPLTTPAPNSSQPKSFAAGRYHVRRFLGEGGKKRVFLAHDQLLDRDVAFALIKTDGLDDIGRERITREAQAMGRMGSHPNLVSVYDLGEEGGAPYIVTELMGGGDVEALLATAGGALELPRALELAKGVARGLAFAHERGIVHRDLKPGNVWLTSNGHDGVAKIGDFGLAVAEGRSRLTQHGLMVGTFGYMPPEQALGNEATPRSDLYSFGCMLYELVTGQQPFTGDTPTAVISQHLNSTPVAPSWHTEHCPPALEDLILALMSKEPGARPASAGEVLATLERIDPSERSRSRSDSAANPLDALARGVFVGRERELERLRSSLDGAFAGRGSVVMLVGEPGIGKTRTIQELETYARMRGATVLWGRAHESSGAPPYWPWVQVARAYRDDTPEEVRRRQYEPYAVELQRIFPGLRDLFPNLPEPLPETEEGQFRLFDAFAAFARSVSTETPLVFVLDDLHWADRATLQLLSHLAREIGRARILVLGTYRDTDLDRRHPLAQTLAELNREDLFTRIPLRGLTFEETADYVRRAASVEPSRELVSRIYEETEGNPFFLSEVVNLMTQEGTLGASISDVRIPEGVKEALGRRLDRLSDDANALLTTLAVAGRDFDHALVRELSTHDDNITLHLVEEALRARVLEETAPGRYRFTHALMQETLLGELSAARRVLLHGQIAEVLERLYGDNRDYLAAIAEHYRESAALNPAHAEKAARTLRLAGDAAAAALAFEEAASLYHAGLELASGAPGTFGEDIAALYAKLARVQVMSDRDGSSWSSSLEHAARLYRERDDIRPLASALINILEGALPQAQVVPLRELLWETARSLRSEVTVEACRLLAFAALADFGPAGDALAAQAEDLSRELGMSAADEPPALQARRVQKLMQQNEYGAAVALVEGLYQTLGDRVHWTVWRIASVALTLMGDPERNGWAIDRGLALARREGRRSEEHSMLRARSDLLWQAGQHEASMDLAAALPPRARRISAARQLLEQGALDEAAAALTWGDDAASARTQAHALHAALRAAIHLAKEERDPAIQWYRRWLTDYEVLRQTQPQNAVTVLAQGGEVAATLGDAQFLQEVARVLADSPQLRGGYGYGFDHLRGLIALRLGQVDEAEAHFRTGWGWASSPEVGFDVHAGRNLYGLAQVEERRGNHLTAMQHLDEAGALFAKRGAKLYLDQVITMKQVLKA